MNTKLSLTLSVKESALNGLTLNEPIDIRTLDLLIHSDLLKEKFRNPYVPFKNEKKQLMNYKDLVENGMAKVTYEKNKNNPYGRSNPKKSLGLFSIRRELRHTLARERFVDIDIENCHPVILYQICESNDIECELLKDYVKNRNKYLELVMNHYKTDREGAKKLFIIMLYGGAINTWKENWNIKVEEDLELVKDFKKEFSTISKIITEKNPEIAEVVKRIKEEQKKEEYSLYSSTTSFYMQEWEIRILEEVFLHCKANGYIENGVCVLCADGLMIEKRLYNENILKEFEELVLNKFNLSLTFTTKEMNQGYDKLDDHLYLDYQEGFNTDLISKVFSLMNDDFLYSKEKLYHYNDVYWEEDDKNMSILKKYVLDVFHPRIIKKVSKKLGSIYDKKKELITNDGKKEEIKEIEENIKKIEAYFKQLNNVKNIKPLNSVCENIVVRITNNNIEFDKNPFLFCFNNKVYDLEKDEFVKPNKADYIKTTTGYEYQEKYDSSNIQELDKIISNILTNKETRDFYLCGLSTGLSGVQIQNWIIASGKGGNGKSLLNSLWLRTLGNYGYKLPSAVLLQPIKSGSADPQVANCHMKRGILASEPDSRRRICCSTAKEMSGDDKINQRGLYSKDCEISMRNTSILECNDLPLLDEVGDAMTRRIRVVPFNSSFVSQEEYDELQEHQKENVFIGNSYYVSTEFKDKYKQALFEILRPYFRMFKNNQFKLPPMSKESKEKTVSYLGVSDNIYEWFSQYYIKADETKHMMELRDIYEDFKNSSFFSNLSKLDKRKYNKTYFEEKIQSNAILKKYCKPRKAYFDNKQQSVAFLVGYRMRGEDEEDDGENDS